MRLTQADKEAAQATSDPASQDLLEAIRAY
jgi:hypothetical protein